MTLHGTTVAVTGAGRDLGRRLALSFAERGADVLVAARDLAAAEATAEAARSRGHGKATAFTCDLADPDSVRAFAAAVGERVSHVDVLVNNGAPYLHGELDDATDAEITATITAGTTGTLLLTRHLLPLLRASPRPDVVTIVSAAGEPGQHRSGAHPAFYAAKHAQSGLSEILSARLRGEGVRVIALYPPDLVQEGPRVTGGQLTAESVVDCVLFAVGQPRDCFIREFHFEQL
ncbi:SDR family NAD(P)-dependent oxidoreductase [Phytomonospora endophytica]|uniref:NAD(P)-dependent dehydrogenase (Short-subunit alcohol dehydrogenase family) n=1 Tax=Phytomonospora endophytica TaxID=714109 RepID=A0A841FQE7_9ACTN|nr:SDR family oxidoreductase [Phytomonospora endophytica]MBB6038375.1 NAD(P)-dependent dehydrogenase (short-subunit alcohol dehydrogenase family) [Phytomonospora endophytica]GIG64306.1 oxidoreductase [Phytomonospora endophytica]